jgi:hypothetical protein
MRIEALKAAAGIDILHVPYRGSADALNDLLAGNDRYKTSLATGTEPLHWFELLPRASLPGLVHRLRQALGRG